MKANWQRLWLMKSLTSHKDIWPDNFERAGQLNLPGMAGLLGAILIGVTNPEAGAVASSIVTGASAQASINFTRANEEEADSVGIQLLARSGYDPQGMPDFF